MLLSGVRMSRKEWALSGPGIVRAVQEAVKRRKDAVFVCDHTENGQLLRVGYALVDHGTTLAPDQAIMWIDPREVRARVADVPDRGLSGQIDIRFKVPQQAHSYTLIQQPLEGDAEMRLRSLIREHRGGSAGFAVQVEVRDSPRADWKPAVRFDTAHGQFHCDMLPAHGSPYKTQEEDLDGEAAIRRAFSELEAHLSEWLEILGFPSEPRFGNTEEMQSRIREARETLLRLWDKPADLADEESRFVQFR